MYQYRNNVRQARAARIAALHTANVRQRTDRRGGNVLSTLRV